MKSFLSPIDEYSNLPFREMCSRYGADATCVPLVNALAIIRGKTIVCDKNEKNLGVQIVGNKGKDIGKAAEIIYKKYPFIKWLNINCGCPSYRTRHCGGGSALLNKPDEIKEALKTMNKIGIPTSIKIRIIKNREKTLEFCNEMDCDFIIIHGRKPEEFYKGKADWELIKYIHENSSVRIIGNGDIQNAEEGERKIKEGYCDGYMICRAAMQNPGVFSNKHLNPKEIFKGYVKECKKWDMLELKDLKLKALQFYRCFPNAAKIRNKIAQSKTLEEILNINQ